jgi:hypothetical protein
MFLYHENISSPREDTTYKPNSQWKTTIQKFKNYYFYRTYDIVSYLGSSM